MSNFYKSTQLQENVYRITSLENVFCELLIGTEKALLIDTGFGYGDLKGFVKSLTGSKPLIIVNTHGHLDHTCGNAQFDEPIFISTKDVELCKAHTSREFRERAAKGAENANDYATGETVRGLPDDFDLEAYVNRGTGQLKPLNDGDVFDLGGIIVRAIATPGHTNGGTCFLYEEQNWLYVGDQANAFCWLFLDETTEKDIHLASLDKLIALAPAKVFGSHMPAPVSVEQLYLYRRAAAEADFEKGLPFNGYAAKKEARTCTLDGMGADDFGKPGFASVVITADWGA